MSSVSYSKYEKKIQNELLNETAESCTKEGESPVVKKNSNEL